VIIIHDVVGFV